MDPLFHAICVEDVTATVRENGRTAKHITHSIALALQNLFGREYCDKGPCVPAMARKLRRTPIGRVLDIAPTAWRH